ncbi:A disintegrin and metalloproteinase with thrombospondin motifs 3 [Gryllus bimaculatus]|nr:A disintegrin and metalloproteinase with thrombospondin motifs 3 [Gryllus bimaculatus]
MFPNESCACVAGYLLQPQVPLATPPDLLLRRASPGGHNVRARQGWLKPSTADTCQGQGCMSRNIVVRCVHRVRAQLCQGGQCVAGKPKSPAKEVAGGWGPWKEEACASGCLVKSRGYQARRRACDNPPPAHNARGCDGSPVDVALCSDDKLCKKKKRKSAVEYAGSACAQFAKLLPELDAGGAGLQAPHEEGRPWVACSVFCKRKDTGLFYTPRLDLNDMGVDAHFPDGTSNEYLKESEELMKQR